MRLKKHGTSQLRLHRQHGGVEALKMAGLQDAFFLAGFDDAEEVVGFSEGGGERLFDEQVEARLKQRRGYRVVVNGGDGDGGGVDLEVGGKKLVDGGEDGDGVFRSGVGSAARVRLDCGDEGYAVTGCL